MWNVQYCGLNLIFLLSLFLENIVVGLFQSVPFLLQADPPYWTHHSCRAEVVLWLAQPAHARDAASLCALVVASYPVQRCNYNLCPLHSSSNALRVPPRGNTSSCIWNNIILYNLFPYQFEIKQVFIFHSSYNEIFYLTLSQNKVYNL